MVRRFSWSALGLCACGTLSGSSGEAPATVIQAQVAVGSSFVCASRVGGTPQCWGSGSAVSGPSWNGVDERTPAPVAGVGDVRELVAGQGQACALSGDGSVRCWGDNGYGESSPDQSTGNLDPTLVDGVTTATQITAGVAFSCALLSDGSVRCWGNVCQPQRSCAIEGIRAAALSHGSDDHACALLTDGRVACFGDNRSGELGAGDLTNHQGAVVVSGISNAKAVAVGGHHSSALLEDGSVVCWGDCGSGIALQPSPVPNMTGATDLGNGANYGNCVRSADGHARCACMETSSGDLTDYLPAAALRVCDFSFETMPGLDHVTQVSLNWDLQMTASTGCATREDASVWCWGFGTSGQFGDGKPEDTYLYDDGGLLLPPRRIPVIL